MLEKLFKFLKDTILHPTWGAIIIMILTLSMTVGLLNLGIILIEVIDSIIHYIFFKISNR